jgi:hypothetical protein
MSTTTWRLIGELRYNSTHSLNTTLDGGEWSASLLSRFTPRQRAPDTHWIGDWVGLRADLDAAAYRKIPSPCRDSNPPIIQSVAQRYTTELSGLDGQFIDSFTDKGWREEGCGLGSMWVPYMSTQSAFWNILPTFSSCSSLCVTASSYRQPFPLTQLLQKTPMRQRMDEMFHKRVPIPGQFSHHMDTQSFRKHSMTNTIHTNYLRIYSKLRDLKFSRWWRIKSRSSVLRRHVMLW